MGFLLPRRAKENRLLRHTIGPYEQEAKRVALASPLRISYIGGTVYLNERLSVLVSTHALFAMLEA